MAYPTDPIYKLVNGIDGTPTCVITVQNGVYLSIPLDETNSDYQEYLEWAKTNTAEAADGLTWDDIRSKRDSILQATDWTVTSGATVDQAQWAAYRQTIRDIPQTYKDKTPDDVVWPTQPSTAGPNT
tara:strand:- start:1048 stop:1428 length:381 start_codon:yes stop_codon:yes gene_type:complete